MIGEDKSCRNRFEWKEYSGDRQSRLYRRQSGLRLLKELTSGTVVSLDNMNDYYEVSLKEWRLKEIHKAAEHSPVEHIL